MADSPKVEISVLGPLRLVVDDRPVEVPGTRRRAVLAMLAMAAPAPATTDRLLYAVWPEEPPASGAGALQSHVSRLRRHLGAAAERLATTDAGYRLTLGPHELDATRARSLVDEARQCAGDDPARAVELLTAARHLWRGEPLAGLDDVAALRAWARSLTELWLDASDLLARCHLATGDVPAATQVAREVLQAEPLREASVVALVRALTADGRAAEALRTAHEFRRRLAEETGLEPSTALGEAEHAAAAGQPAPPDATQYGPPRRTVPSPVSRLLGRDAELAGIGRLVQSERLVTIVGPGGAGKTHVALETALRAERRRDVTVVPLATVTHDDAVVDAMADALGLHADAGDLVDRCVLRLRPGRQLLVLDNCEHVLGAARDLVSTLIAGCPELTVLATSRERLGLPAEQTCWLGPLPLPDPDHRGDLTTVPSVALFIDRVQRAGGRVDTTEPHLAAVGRIVRALDGLPLAIELAAGRLSSMSVEGLEARLDRALDLLAAPAASGGAGVSAAGRHRTLRATVEWSYDLLPNDERRLFRTLAVFPGGFDLTTAERIATDLGVAADPAASVGHLVDTCMVVAELQAAPEARYRMLDTLRGFGLDRLRAESEAEDAHRRLVAWARDFAAWLEDTVLTEDESTADARLRAELSNLRTAWRVARDAGDIDNAAALVVLLYSAVSWRDLTEVWRWALELADDPGLAGHAMEAAVLGVASEGAWFSAGDLDGAETLARRGLTVAAADDGLGRAMSSWALGDVHLFRGRFEEATKLVVDSRVGTRWACEGYAQGALATAYGGDLDGARRLLEQARVAATGPTLRGYVRYVHGEVAGLAGDHGAAEVAYRDAIAAARTSGASFLEGVASVGLVSVQVAQGKNADALSGYRDLIARWERTGSWTQQWTTLRNLAELLDRLGDGETAATLRTAADRAPEAATVARTSAGGTTSGAPSAAVDRDAVLAVAREAIARALGT